MTIARASHINIAFCKSTVVTARDGGPTQAWAMGWLTGVGCSGYTARRGWSGEVQGAYNAGLAEGRAAKKMFEAETVPAMKAVRP